MRTTVEIADELLKAARKTAIDEGISFRELLEDALSARLGGTTTPYAGFESRGDLYQSGKEFLDQFEAALEEGARRRAARERAS